MEEGTFLMLLTCCCFHNLAIYSSSRKLLQNHSFHFRVGQTCNNQDFSAHMKEFSFPETISTNPPISNIATGETSQATTSDTIIHFNPFHPLSLNFLHFQSFSSILSTRINFHCHHDIMVWTYNFK